RPAPCSPSPSLRRQWSCSAAVWPAGSRPGPGRVPAGSELPGERPAGGAPGEDAASQEGAFESVVSVGAAATETGGLASREQAADGVAVLAERASVEVGLDAAQRFASEDVQFHADEGPGGGIEDLVRPRYPHEPVAEVAAAVAD